MASKQDMTGFKSFPVKGKVDRSDPKKKKKKATTTTAKKKKTTPKKKKKSNYQNVFETAKKVRARQSKTKNSG